jgi:hypothetical protein
MEITNFRNIFKPQTQPQIKMYPESYPETG